MPKHPRVIGTTPEAIAKAEAATGFQFPTSFRDWLLRNNGLGLEDLRIFPVLDARDPRKTWDSIVREHEAAMRGWAEVFGGNPRASFSNLLAFADAGTGNYYCFDYTVPTMPGEYPVVRVSHETGERQVKAQTFEEFVAKVASGAFEND